MPRGGKRPNSGPAKGTKYGPQKATITKEQARDALRTVVINHMDEMIAAQIANSKGLQYLVARDKKTGKFERIGPEGVSPDAQIEVWQKDPSIQAFTDLMNRALDKPKEQAMDINVDVTTHEGRRQRLEQGRQRNAKLLNP